MRYQPAFDSVTGQPYLPVVQRGRALLEEPLLNKGTAFTDAERHSLGLAGLLPRHVSTLEEQVERTLDQLTDKADDLQRHIYLAGLHDRNEILFHRLLLDHVEATVPIIYTPTVAEACRHWSRIFRRARGLYVTPDDRGDVERLLLNYQMPEAAVIVVTDNERILGIGDQGAGGMGIPIGKLALYSAAAGIHPSLCLPVSLDVGTDNAELLDDPLYLGYRAPRLRGDAYWDLVDELVDAVRTVYPGAILQWEDFGNQTSFRHLEAHRQTIPSFNDDIQGTAAMVVGGLHVAMRLQRARLRDQRVVVAGAGSAGAGIAMLLRSAMVSDGLGEAEARSRILVTDSNGLVMAGEAREHKVEVAADPALVSGWDTRRDRLDLATVIRNHGPSVLIGVTGRPGTFTEEMIRNMAAAHRHPVVMPLSNPTASVEATPEAVIRWSDGRCLVATGSPFPSVGSGSDERLVGQANNVFVFPGLGLGAIVARARSITDGMLLAAARALADSVSRERSKAGALYPSMTDVRQVSRTVALAVAEQATEDGVAPALSDPERSVDRAMWDPVYLPYRPA